MKVSSFSETAIRTGRKDAVRPFGEPTGSDVSFRIEQGDMGFDVQKQRSIDHVHILDMKDKPFDPDEFHE